MNETFQYHKGLISKPDCEGCPLQGSKIIPPEGNPRARIVLVGDGPSWEDDRDNKQFAGSGGQLLNRLLTRAGIQRESLWITQPHLCRTKTIIQDDKPISPESVSRTATKHCKSRLDQELAIIQPKVILGFGNQSVRSVYSATASLKGRRGGIHTVDLLQLNNEGLVEEEELEDDEE